MQPLRWLLRTAVGELDWENTLISVHIHHITHSAEGGPFQKLAPHPHSTSFLHPATVQTSVCMRLFCCCFFYDNKSLLFKSLNNIDWITVSHLLLTLNITNITAYHHIKSHIMSHHITISTSNFNVYINQSIKTSNKLDWLFCSEDFFLFVWNTL